MEAPGQFQPFQEYRPGDIIAERYEILEEIGRGGMSTIYRCRENVLQRNIALKVINPAAIGAGSNYLERFRREAKSASAMDHPNIVRVFASGVSSNGVAFMAMELLEGRTLEALLKAEGCLNQESFAEVFIPVLSALEYAHENQIVHRDLKPANIMILTEKSTGGSIIKMLDFGVAKDLRQEPDSSAALTRGLVGTPYYMSPEQCNGSPVDMRSDIYSLGCVMFESLSGKPPFTGGAAFEVMYGHTHLPVPKLPDLSGSQQISGKLVAVIFKALSKKPGDRQSTVSELRSELEDALSSSGKHPIHAGKSDIRIFLAGVLVLSAIAFALLLGLKGQSNKSVTVPASENSFPPKLATQSLSGSINVVKKLVIEGKSAEANKLLAEITLQIQKGRITDEQRLSLLSSAADCHNSLQNFSIAESLYRQAFALLSADKLILRRLEILAHIGEMLHGQNKWDAEERLYKSFITELEGVDGSELEFTLGGAYLQIAKYYFQVGRIAEALGFAEKSLKVLDNCGSGRYNDFGIEATKIYCLSQIKLGHRTQGLAQFRNTKQSLDNYAGSEKLAISFLGLARLACELGLYKDGEKLIESALRESTREAPARARFVQEGCRRVMAKIERLKKTPQLSR